MYDTISFSSTYGDVRDITDDVREKVLNSQVKDGICVIFCPHTTASVGLAPRGDREACLDIQDQLDRLFPLRATFQHVETPFDAAGHIKSAIFGLETTLIIEDGELLLDESQGIYFFDFDGPRPRKVQIKCWGK